MINCHISQSTYIILKISNINLIRFERFWWFSAAAVECRASKVRMMIEGTSVKNQTNVSSFSQSWLMSSQRNSIFIYASRAHSHYVVVYKHK